MEPQSAFVIADLHFREEFRNALGGGYDVHRYSQSLCPDRIVGRVLVFTGCEAPPEIRIYATLPVEYHTRENLKSLATEVLARWDPVGEHSWRIQLSAETSGGMGQASPGMWMT